MVETSVTGRKSASDIPNLNFSGLLNTSGGTGNTVAKASMKTGTLTAAETAPQNQEVPEIIKVYKAVFRDAYNFLEKHSPHEADSDGTYWDKVIDDFSMLSAKYAEDEAARYLASDVIAAAFAELEREYKIING